MMSEIMEKTLASLPDVLGTNKGSGTSKAFQHFVKLVGSCKSKHDETQLVKKELALQEQRLAQPDVTLSTKRESLIRLVYCHMLGSDVNFAFIHAVKLAQQGTILEKRVGYLTCSLFLHDQHELVMLLVNTIQKDLQSTNILEVCTALSAASYLVGSEMIPALLPLVEEKLTHSREVVRKKAVLCLHQFWRKAPSLVQHVFHRLPLVLSDRDPSVVWASLHLYHDLVKLDPAPYTNLVMAFLGVLEQIISRHLPADYEYHTVPAPWTVILLLKILARLGEGNQSASEKMYVVLKDVLQRTEPTHKMGLAVIYECLETVAAIYPHQGMIEHASMCVGRFLSATNLNLKYVGLKALISIVKVSPGYAAQHQAVVMDCLEHPDLTIRRKTLDLLYRMATPANVQVICGRLLEHLTTTNDQYLKLDIIDKVSNLIERLSQSLEWYVSTMNELLVMSGDLIPPTAEHSIIAHIQTGEVPQEMSVFLVRSYYQLMLRNKLPEVLIRVAAWVVGEYFTEEADIQIDDLTALLVKWFRQSGEDITRLWILQTLIKLSSNHPVNLENISVIINPMVEKSCESREVTQRIHELKRMCQIKADQGLSLKELDVTGSEIDFTVSFLDEFVSEALELGASPYQPAHHRDPHIAPLKGPEPLFEGLNFAPYDPGQKASVGSVSGASGDRLSGQGSLSERGSLSGRGSPALSSTDSREREETTLKLQPKRRVWGKEGVFEESNKPLDRLTNSDNNIHISSKGYAGPSRPRSLSPEEEAIAAEREKKKMLASALFGSLTESPGDQTSTSSASFSGVISQSQSSIDQNGQLPGSLSKSTHEPLNPWASRRQTNSENTSQTVLVPGDRDSQSDYNSESMYSLPLEELQRLGGANVGLLETGDFQSPCEENSMFSSLRMDDIQNGEYVSVNTFHSYPGRKPKSGDTYWNDLNHTKEESSAEDPKHPPQDPVMSTSDTSAKWPHKSKGDEASTAEMTTSPTDSLDDLSAAGTSDYDDIPPMEFHAEEHKSVETNSLFRQRTMSMQSNDKLIVFQSESLAIEVVKRTLPDRLELVLWMTPLSQEIEQSVFISKGRLKLEAMNKFEFEVPDSEKDEELDEFQLHEFQCDGSSPGHVSVLLRPHATDTDDLPSSVSIDLRLPGLTSDRIHLLIPLSLADFLRPEMLSVEEFTRLWPGCSADTRMTITNNGHEDVRAWTACISETAHLQLVQQQDGESLLCGRWLSNNDRVLLHCRVLPDLVHLRVKSTNDSLLNTVSACLAKIDSA